MNIKFKNVTKKFKKEVVLDDISFELETGMIHAVIGGQGSGKTTLLQLISRKCFPTTGTILYNDDEMINKDLSLSHLTIPLYSPRRVKNIFEKFVSLYPNFDVEYAKQLAESFNVSNEIWSTMASSGVLSIMKIIISLASNEEIIILDESILGLDVINRNIFYDELLAKYNKDKQTFILTSTVINELSSLINSFILLKDKKVLMHKNIDSLDTAFVISGSKETIKKYCTDDCLVLKELENYMEIIVFNNKEDLSTLDVRSVTLLDIVESRGVNNV